RPGRRGCWHWCGGLVQRRGRGSVDDDRHPRVTAQAFLRRALQGLEVMLHEPVTREPIRGSNLQMVALDGLEMARAQPRIEDRWRQLAGKRFQEAGPEAIQDRLRPRFHASPLSESLRERTSLRGPPFPFCLLPRGDVVDGEEDQAPHL